MKFDIQGGTVSIWSCNNCLFNSTKEQFGDGPTCPFCFGGASKLEEIEPQFGMSPFMYRGLLDYIRENADGVGSATIENIEDFFDDGDAFIDAVEQAYRNRNWEELTCVQGIGRASAEKIALAIAEKRHWEDGAAEMAFDIP